MVLTTLAFEGVLFDLAHFDGAAFDFALNDLDGDVTDFALAGFAGDAFDFDFVFAAIL